MAIPRSAGLHWPRLAASEMRERLAPYAPATALTVVALLQIYASTVGPLSAWKGGGFGMFSTIDSPGSRFLRAYLHTEGHAVIVRVPASLLGLEREIRTLPLRRRLQDLANQMGNGIWVSTSVIPPGDRYRQLWRRYEEGQKGASREDKAAEAAIEAQNVRWVYRMLDGRDRDDAGDPVRVDRLDLEVWQIRFDRTRERLEAAPILSASANLHGVPGR